MKKIILLSLIMCVVLNSSGSWGYAHMSHVGGVYFDNGVYVDVEVVNTREDLAKGLMFRESLEENMGMLFIFDSEDYHPFWMKNMNFPIDIIWLSSDFKVVHIEQNVQPCKTDCQVYTPAKPARYVLEINTGFTERNGISIENKISLNDSLV